MSNSVQVIFWTAAVGLSLLSLGFRVRSSPRWLLRFLGGLLLCTAGVFAMMALSGDF